MLSYSTQSQNQTRRSFAGDDTTYCMRFIDENLQLIEDKTFGLKNKNKSKSVQVRLGIMFFPHVVRGALSSSYLEKVRRKRLGENFLAPVY